MADRKFFRDSWASLAFAHAGGEKTVTVLLAARRNKLQDVVDRVSQIAGSVLRRWDDIDCARVAVPVAAVNDLRTDRAIEVASVVFVHDYTSPPAGVASNGGAAHEEHSFRGAGRDRFVVSMPREETEGLTDPIADPYSPMTDIGAAGFLTQHPTFDGRGVTVAIVDDFIDLLLPEFQTATMLDGRPAPKVLDYVNPLDPALDPGPEWVTAWQQVTAVERTFAVRGHEFTAPHDGTFWLGFLDESRLLKYAGRSGVRVRLSFRPENERSSPLYGVLWEKTENIVWVDTDQDRNFANERPMTDYVHRQDIGVFGDPDWRSPVRESVMFTVQTRADRDAVSINIGAGSHATMVSGATFGSRGHAGRYDGIAPGTQIISVTSSAGHGRPTVATYLEAMIFAMSDPRTDLVVVEPSTRWEVRYLPKDASSIMSVVAQRLVERYDKPLFVPACNAPFLNQIGEGSVGPGVIGVGGYQSKDNYLINDGVLQQQRDNLHPASSHGPAGDGGMAPLILAPTNLLSSEVGCVVEDSGAHHLPPGYTIGRGTSTAAPAAAAATALLISAAKQSGITYTAPQIRQALCTSARFITHIPAHWQGHGLIQVDAAWRFLNDAHENQCGTKITVAAPVRTAVSSWLKEPHQGRGLYEREGWAPGDRRSRSIILTRTSGNPDPVTYDLSWLGNDATFATARQVTLPLSEAVELPVEIAPITAGVHSAALVLRQLDHPQDEHRVLLTVVAAGPHDLSHRHSFNAELEFGTAYPGSTFFTVPAGVNVLQFETGVKVFQFDKETGAAPLFRVSPPDANPYPFLLSKDTWTCEGSTRYTFSYPPSGVWEAVFNDFGSSMNAGEELREAIRAVTRNGQLTVAAYGVEVIPQAGEGIDPAPGSHLDVRVDLVNRRAPFTGVLSSRPLGGARASTATITEHEIHVHDIDVPVGSDLVLTNLITDNEGAELDMYLFDCSGDIPRLVKRRVGIPPGGVLTAERPVPGLWKLVIVAVAVPGQSLTYQYIDVVTNPRYGSFSTAEVPRERASGEQWHVTAHCWISEPPEGDRLPAALMLITSDDVREPVPPTRLDVEVLVDGPESLPPDGKIEHAPLGWATLLISPSGNRVVTG